MRSRIIKEKKGREKKLKHFRIENANLIPTRRGEFINGRFSSTFVYWRMVAGRAPSTGRSAYYFERSTRSEFF